MMDKQQNSKVIFKNTILLYLRMLITMVINLYTSRIVLNKLGVEDYGIYNVIGGVVIMFSFIRNTLSTSTVRYFSYELGKQNSSDLKKIFSLCMNVQVLISLAILIVCESIGLWFINNKMVFPIERIDAVHWTFQLSLIGVIITMLQIPYNSVIIAFEKMQVFAYISIVDAVIKLIIAFLIDISNFDRLIFFSFLMLISITLIYTIYYIYCKYKIPTCNYIYYSSKDKLIEIFSFNGWNFLGSLAVMGKGQAMNILLNIFFGPSVNTAHGLSYKISVIVNQFTQNFLTAIRPQLIKSYAQCDFEKVYKLTFFSSKSAFYLLLIITLPIILETKLILFLWLGIIPEHLVIFLRLSLLETLAFSLSFPLHDIINASGKVKQYNILVSSFILLNLPISYYFLKAGYNPEIIYYIMIITSFLSLFIRLYVIKKKVGISIIDYIKQVLIPCFFVLVFSFISSYIIIPYINLSNKILSISCLIILIISTIWIFGFTKNEKNIFSKALNNLKNKYLS